MSKSSLHTEPSDIIAAAANEWLATFPKELLIDPIDYQILNRWLEDLAGVLSRQIRKVSPQKLYFTHEDVVSTPSNYLKLFTYFNLMRQGVIAIGEPITANNKDRHRNILQWLGGYLVTRAGKGFWFDKIEEIILDAKERGIQLHVVGGLRFPYDAAVIRRNGGKIIKLIRLDLPERELDDPTESQRHLIKYDVLFVSDSIQGTLSEAVRAFYHDLLLGDVMEQYRSSDFAPLA